MKPIPREESSVKADRPLLLTQGDAAGIGPEVIAQAWARVPEPAAVVVGDPQVMRRALAQCRLQRPVQVLETISEPRLPGAMAVWAPPGLPATLLQGSQGLVRADCGLAAARCIEAAVGAIQSGAARGLVTAPVHKEALHAAGVPFPGHTEMLQHLAGVPAVRMMLVNDELRVALVTVHVSLRKALDLIDGPTILETVRQVHAMLVGPLGIAAPRIAVAGLNPHAGEGGLFGDEEVTTIGPAVQQAQSEGLQVHGPYAPDTVFMRARRGEFDAVVAMTHDHGLIPIKYLGLDAGVNLTLGLPFVRTSPDHGTAFDRVGRGTADPSSFLAAWQLGQRLTISAG
ncbi:4-hydroxythreonine-4-phosphate dehydrogenase PdxA [Inhella gelatinilytica]|uniref:4-hydroxythreonine-4-phosphate dehydrogenase PdxA n=1 Tax=Inhella gelatinilytica TaxID=2795030 RepID=A0A931IYD4_9BURK|nr:4-hydroxythreonine-4-phosphate dehydrogenase PdxA [Inhella gelatinilytica]MBH9553260.1 4-hydroxythreonine-4-phosphate dehydrogenase PdxA [Inhella gelatinilytica]